MALFMSWGTAILWRAKGRFYVDDPSVGGYLGFTYARRKELTKAGPITPNRRRSVIKTRTGDDIWLYFYWITDQRQ